ncbi:MAG: LysM peptidoglycan-binding domain-containing protein [Solirubrobacteraceae bacterium]
MVRKSARFLAPIALVAVAVGVYVTVHSTLLHHGASSAGTTTITTSSSDGHGRSAHRGKRAPKFYRVRAGDTLSAISNKVGIPVNQLLKLNPRLQAAPNSLSTGQRLRLRR